MAITPPSLFGIARKTAYRNKKYHSGLMCNGDERGFAKIKFSTSPKTKGNTRTAIRKIIIIRRLIRSFCIK